MKQTLRKHNAAYAEQMRLFRENPVSETEEEVEPAGASGSEDEASERELNTEEEEEAKFKSGARWRGAPGAACTARSGPGGPARAAAPCLTPVPACPAPWPCLSPRAVRTGVVQRPKDKILTMDPKEITYEMVQKKLGEIAQARGKTTRIDRQEQARAAAGRAGGRGRPAMTHGQRCQPVLVPALAHAAFCPFSAPALPLRRSRC